MQHDFTNSHIQSYQILLHLKTIQVFNFQAKITTGKVTLDAKMEKKERNDENLGREMYGRCRNREGC